MRYGDIINLPHHVSSTRPRMSMHDRAAQFSPFAALTGYDDAIAEAARSTDQRIEPSESAREEIMQVLSACEGHIVAVSWFEPDRRKSGGKFHHLVASARQVDFKHAMLLLDNGKSLGFDSIERLEFAESHEFGPDASPYSHDM